MSDVIKNATPGPWKIESHEELGRTVYCVRGTGTCRECDRPDCSGRSPVLAYDISKGDAEFLVYAREKLEQSERDAEELTLLRAYHEASEATLDEEHACDADLNRLSAARFALREKKR